MVCSTIRQNDHHQLVCNTIVDFIDDSYNKDYSYSNGSITLYQCDGSPITHFNKTNLGMVGPQALMSFTSIFNMQVGRGGGVRDGSDWDGVGDLE